MFALLRGCSASCALLPSLHPPVGLPQNWGRGRPALLTTRYDSWYDPGMSVAKITISIDERLLDRLDLLVQSRLFTSRSQAVQEAVQEKVAHVGKTRLAEECAKLDPAEEQTFAEEGFAAEVSQWPPY